jgi:hypothetical protein
MHIHEYSIETLYHMKCDKCDNWWSYAHTPDLTYITNHDPRTFMKDRKMACPHCKTEGVFKEKSC